MRLVIFNMERDQETLTKQYHSCINNFQIYFNSINDENLQLKTKIAQVQRELLIVKEERDKLEASLELKLMQQAEVFKMKEQKSKLKKDSYKMIIEDLTKQTQALAQNLQADRGQLCTLLSTQEEMMSKFKKEAETGREASNLMIDMNEKHEQELRQMNALLVEAQNESVHLNSRIEQLEVRYGKYLEKQALYEEEIAGLRDKYT